MLLRQAFPGVDIDVAVGGLDFDRFDILINASPIGMLDPDACPLQVETLPPHLAVLDIVMKPDETRLLRTAIESGCRVAYDRELHGSQLSAGVDFLMPPRTDRQR